jgi:hypothetical protein
VHIDRFVSGSIVRVFVLMTVVFLGLFVDFFTYGGPIHWRPCKLWDDECSRRSQCRQRLHPRPSILFVPIDVRHVFPVLNRAKKYSCTAELVMGGTVERGALGPSLIFIFIWTTIVYDAVAEWTWNPNGWIYRLGGLDFAGGGIRP